MGTIGDVTKSYLEKYPKTESRQLARMLLKGEPELFHSFKQAYSRVRYYRGANGKKSRNDANITEPTTPEPRMPKTESTEWSFYKLPNKRLKYLCLADIHVPFHDEKACHKALDHGKKNGCNAVILNGDIADCHTLSRYVRNPKSRDYSSEVEKTKEMFEYIKWCINPKKIIWKIGNHEMRLYNYLFQRAPELFGLEQLTFQSLYDTERFGIEIVDDNRLITVNDEFFILHGHEYSQALLSPVNPARGVFLRGHVCAVVAHSHRASHHEEPTFAGNTISTWSMACLCNLHPEYQRLNRWMNGHGIIDTYRGGNWEYHNYKHLKRRVVSA